MVTTVALHERVVSTFLGLHPRVAPNVYQEPYRGPVERSLRSMVSTMALHERVVNTLLGLHSRVAPNVYPEPIAWSGKAFVAKNGVHDGST